jgi:2-keto-4-pentenoate hydratase
MGVAEPNYGCLLESVVIDGDLHLDELIRPRVEPEVAFIMGEDVSGPGVTADRILRATRWVCGCIEVVDSRFADYRFRLEDNTADNSSSARLVLGEKLLPVDGLDLRLLGAALLKNGEVMLTGAGAAALGHPARSVAWIVNELARAGETLRAGQIVISGGLTSAPFIEKGDQFTAWFDHLGPVSVRGL